jgi:hypothetical protein
MKLLVLFGLTLLCILPCFFVSCDSRRGNWVGQAGDSNAGADAVLAVNVPLLVEKEWRSREAPVIAAVEGRAFKSHELGLARDFFLQLTGVIVPIEQDRQLSWRPTKATGAALPLLRNWFVLNHKRLYWDKKANTVKICWLPVSRGGQAAGQYGVAPVWHAHELVFEELKKTPAQGTLVEFQDAVEFFDELTGVPLRGDGSYVGFMPTAETLEDFKLVETWYEKNKENLCWDSMSGTIEFCRPSQSSQAR